MGLELARAYIRVQADSSGLSQQFSSIQQDVESSLAGAKKAALGIFGIFAGGMAGILRSGLMAAGQFEQTTIAFETMLGSAKETQEILNKLTIFAAKTPFEMPEITQAARGLIQFGERGDELMETLNILGNAAAGSSTPFSFLALVFNQVRGVGKLLTQDFRQLSTRGIISMQDLADYLGVSLSEAEKKLSSGAIKFEDLRKILKKLSSEGGRFFKLMERQSTSLLGLSSTLNDAWNIMFRILATSLMPAAKGLQSVIIKAVETMQLFVEYTDGMAGSAMAGAVAFSVLGAAILGAGLAAKFFGMTLKGALVGSGIGVLFVVLGAIAGMLIDRFDVLEKGTKLLGDAIEGMKEPLLDLLEWMKVIYINADGIWAQLPLMIGVALSYAGDIIRNSGPILVQAMGYALGQMVALLMPWVTMMSSTIGSLFTTLGSIAVNGITSMVGFVMSGLGSLASVFTNIGTFLFEIWSGLFSNIGTYTGAIINYIISLISSLINGIVEYFSSFYNVMTTNWTNIWTFIGSIISNSAAAIHTGIGNLLMGIVSAVTNFGTTLHNMWGSIWSGLAGIASAAWSGGKQAVMDLVSGMFNEISKISADFTKGFVGQAPDFAAMFTPSQATLDKMDTIKVDDKMKREKDLMEKARKKEGPKSTAAAVKPETTAASALKAGRYSLPEFGNKLQDTLLKKDDSTKLDETRNGLLESSLEKQDKIIAAIEGMTGTAATLTGGDQ
jgi:tape measure domain-containing protein